MANILTSARILCGLLLLCFPAFSGRYYVLYLIGGLTDAVDGLAARRLGTESAFGAKYDTAADFVFAISVLIKIIRSVYFPLWVFIWVCVILAGKLMNLAIGLIRYRRMIAVHSVVNKICGAVCFLLPLILGSGCAWQGKAAAVLIGLISASAAAIHESIQVWTGKAVR